MCRKRTRPAQSRGLDAAPNEVFLFEFVRRDFDRGMMPCCHGAAMQADAVRYLDISTSTAFPARLRVVPDDEFAAFLLLSPQRPLDKLGSGNCASRAEAEAFRSGSVGKRLSMHWVSRSKHWVSRSTQCRFWAAADYDQKEEQNASRRPPARRSVHLRRPGTGRAPIRAVAATRKLPAISATVSGGDTNSSSRRRPGCSRRCRNWCHRRKCRQRCRHWRRGWWRGCGRAPRFSSLRWGMLLTPARSSVAPRRNRERTLP